MRLDINLVGVLSLLIGSLAAEGQLVETRSFTNLNRSIPDGNWAGLSDVHSVTSAVARITGLRVRLRLVGEFNGDLYCYLRHIDGAATNFCVLLNRVGRTTSNPYGYADAGLDITLGDLASGGNIHSYRNVTNLPSGLPLQGAWQPDGRRVDPSTVLDTSPVSTTLSSFAGADASGEWTLFVADVDKGGTNLLAGWDLEISGFGRAVVTWPAPADIIYGTALGPTQLNASCPIAGAFAYNPPANSVLNAGTQTLRTVFTPTDPNYLSITSSVTLHVLQKTLTVTVMNTNKLYGAPLPTFAATYSGFVNGDTIGSLSARAQLTTTATANSPVGTYSILASGASGSNYSMQYVNGTLTIGKAAVAGTVNVSQNPAVPGTAVTFSLSLSAVAPGAGTPTGTIQFRIDGLPAGSPAALTGGTAYYSTASLSLGSHVIVAEYAGDGNFTGITNRLSPDLLINTLPVAGTDTIYRYGTNAVKVLVTTLLSNDSDADGDRVSFLGINSGSASSGSISQEGNWIVYVPAANSTNNDSFTYFISDGRGAPVLGTVFVNVQPDTVPCPNLVIVDLFNGSFMVQFNGVVGCRYRIEYRESLGAGWQPLGSATADQYGLFAYLDTPPSGSLQRYYRSVYP